MIVELGLLWSVHTNQNIRPNTGYVWGWQSDEEECIKRHSDPI
jgi:hypothetical protein